MNLYLGSGICFFNASCLVAGPQGMASTAKAHPPCLLREVLSSFAASTSSSIVVIKTYAISVRCENATVGIQLSSLSFKIVSTLVLGSGLYSNRILSTPGCQQLGSPGGFLRAVEIFLSRLIVRCFKSWLIPIGIPSAFLKILTSALVVSRVVSAVKACMSSFT